MKKFTVIALILFSMQASSQQSMWDQMAEDIRCHPLAGGNCTSGAAQRAERMHQRNEIQSKCRSVCSGYRNLGFNSYNQCLDLCLLEYSK